jgi:LPXTG-site transpeptidase (sortase) family protein
MYSIKLHDIVERITAYKWRFLVWFVIIFLFTLFMLAGLGLVPESVDPNRKEDTSSVVSVSQPVRIVIPRVKIDSVIESPSSTNTQVLDEALTRGVVHYPGSGLLNEEANVFLFGHSSFLPVVINKNYQVFNGLRLLRAGDEIFVQSDTREYVYRVSSVTLSDAEEVRVDFEEGVRRLTLSTCNSFGAKDERYVVEAEFVGSHLLES